MNPLPPGWALATLGDVAAWGSGGTPKADQREYYGGDIRWAVIGDLNDGHVSTTASSITKTAVENSSAKVVPPGTLLVAMYGSIGKLGITDVSMATNQAIAFARPGDAVDLSFLFYYLMYQRRALAAAGKGATQQNISQTIIKGWPIPVPPLQEQWRIVAAIEDEFSRIDAAGGVLRATSRGIDRLRSAVLATITPADGAWTRLGDIADIVGGVTKDSKRQQDPSFVEVPYLRVANVQRGYLDLSEVTTIRVPRDKATALRLMPGDVLFNEGGDRDKLGRGWVWQGEVDDCIHQNHVFRARLRDNRFNPKFVSMHGNTFGQRWFEQMGKQTTNLASINLKTLKAFPIPELPLEDQRRLVAEAERQLTLADSCSTAVEHALTRSRHLRSAVLASAFAGRLSN